MEKKKSILIVEDEIIVAENLKESLMENGYSIAGVCADGKDAVQKALETQPDLILMDIKLEGDMDGVEAADRIHRFLDVPFIYLTAWLDETIERAERTLPSAFINKPYSTKDVLNNVRIVLRKHEKELEKREEMTRRTRHAAEQFLAHITHEMRNPLSVIRGYGGLLKDFGATDQQVKFIQKIISSTEKASALVDEILDYSKMAVGQFNLEMKDFALLEKLGEIIDTYSGMFEEKNLELHADIAPDVPEYVKGDPVRFEQILTNLLGNALKFTEKGYCRIDVRRKEQGKKEAADKNKITLEFSVKDTGIGIPEDKQETIFDPFIQADSSHMSKGTGLGLTITRQMVELMDGEIWVKSRQDEGTTFTFTAVFETGKPGTVKE
jgi:signal transduction histidine kinase